MQHTEQIIGRTRELALLDLAIGSGGDGLRLVHIHGPSGMGTTTLAAAGAAAARDRGFHVSVVQGRAGSLSTPFAPVLEAFPELASVSVLLEERPGSLDIDHLAVALRELLIAAATHAPQLVLVDDVQSMDVSSIALMSCVLGLPETTNLTFVFVEQTDAVGVTAAHREFLERDLGSRAATHLELGPLPAEAIEEIATRAARASGTVVDAPEIVGLAEGNPWFAIDLASATDGMSGSSRPSTIMAATTARLHSLSESTRHLVRAIALCDGGAHVSWIAALAELTPVDALAALTAADQVGLVAIEGDVARMRHPVARAATIANMSVAARRVAHRELTEALLRSTSDEVVTARSLGHHLEGAGAHFDAVDQYLHAADLSMARGFPHEACADIERALTIETRIPARIGQLRRLGALTAALGTVRSATCWAELGRLATSIGDEDLLAFALVQQYAGDGHRTEQLQRAARIAPDRIGWSARAAGALARSRSNHETAARFDERAVELARATGDKELEALALEALATSRHHAGEIHSAIATSREAVEKAVALGMHDTAVKAWANLVQMLLDELRTDEAHVQAQCAHAYVVEHRLDRRRPWILATLADVQLRAGDLDAALASVREATDLDRGYRSNPEYSSSHLEAFVLLLRADVAIDLGDDAALTHADAACRAMDAVGYRPWQLEARFARSRARAARHGIDAVLHEFSALDTCEEPEFVAKAVRWMLRASVRAGSAAGIARATELRDAASLWGSSPVCCITLEELDATFAALLGGPTGDLERCAERWAGAGHHLESLRVLATAGAILLDGDAAGDGMALLKSAKHGLTRRGAALDADQIAALLRGAGVRSRASSRSTNIAGLTTRELQIARLVATGLRNRDIAAHLLVSSKTVAAHLTSVYDKVGAPSRMALVQWVSEHDAAASEHFVAAG